MSPETLLKEGSSVLLTCNVESQVNITYAWYLNNTLLQGSDKRLSLSSLHQTDTGHYKCIVSTKYKQKSSDVIFLQVHSKLYLVILIHTCANLFFNYCKTNLKAVNFFKIVTMKTKPTCVNKSERNDSFILLIIIQFVIQFTLLLSVI